MNDIPRSFDVDHIWQEVWEYLLSTLSGLSPAGKQKLSALASTPKGKLCATCLAIDLSASALIPQQPIKILESLSDNSGDICDRIAAILSHDEHDLFNCCSQLESPPLAASDAYVTVMEISSFITKFVTPNTGEGLAQVEVDKILDTYFDEEGDLSSLTKCDLGPSRRLWVVPKSDFYHLLELVEENGSGKVFLDALGLTFKKGHGVNQLPHLVAVLHPPGHDCGAKQPTSLDAWWGNAHVQFISFYKHDGWGRTYSCTGSRYFYGDNEGMARERVHRKKIALAGFTGRSIGTWGPVLNISQEEVFKAALWRFTRANSLAG